MAMEEARSYKYGSRGSHIRDLQKKLQVAGYIVAVDGIFGNETKRAVEELENDLSFSEDSKSFSVDPRTLEVLFDEDQENRTSVLCPKGKGMFVRVFSHMGDPKNLAGFIKEYGISWIAVLRAHFYEDKKPQIYNKNWQPYIDVLEQTNCDLWIWGWPHPSNIDDFIHVMEETREEWGATGIIADVEKDFYNKQEKADELSQKLESLGCPVGVTSYGYAKFHPKFPFSSFCKLDFGIPQIYESSSSYNFDKDYPTKCLDSWKDLGFSKLIPASSAYKAPNDMRDLLSRTPVDDCIVWWDWHNANLRKGRWDVIKEYQFKLPV